MKKNRKTQKIKPKPGRQWQIGPGIVMELLPGSAGGELQFTLDPGFSVAMIPSTDRIQHESSRGTGSTAPPQ